MKPHEFRKRHGHVPGRLAVGVKLANDVKSSSNARLTHRLPTSGDEQTGTALLPAGARHGQSEGGGTRGDVPGLHGALKNGRKNENPVKLREKKEIHKR